MRVKTCPGICFVFWRDARYRGKQMQNQTFHVLFVLPYFAIKLFVWMQILTKVWNQDQQAWTKHQRSAINKHPKITKHQQVPNINPPRSLVAVFFFSVALFCCTRSYIGPRFLELTSRIITWVKWSRLPPAFVWIIEWRLWIGLYFGLSPFMKGTCFVGEWYLFPSATD